jgi:putative transposase
MSEHIHKRHNKNLILYHLVCPVKYRLDIISKELEQTIEQNCLEISKRYEIYFVEIGTDEDHVHLLIQSTPNMMPSGIVRTVKSIIAKRIFAEHPEIRKFLWGGKFWSSGYYINTVGHYGNEKVIANYVRDQGKSYKQIHRSEPTLFDCLD